MRNHGLPHVLHLANRQDPVAGPGEVLISVKASGVNRPDLLQRAGKYPPPPGVSEVLGLEVAGQIVAGDQAAMQQAGFNIGERVCALVAGGGYAQLCVAPVGQCLPVPQGLTDVQAASLPETFFTVWSNLFDRCGLKKCERLLIQGGTSGIGVAAIQIAKAMGVTVLATAGSDEKCAACLELGADHAINYKTTDFVAAVQQMTLGQGVDVVLDMVGGAYIDRELQCLAEDGRLVLIALQGGTRAEIDAALVLRKRLTITGSTLRQRSVEFKATIAQALRTHVWPLVASKVIKPVVFQTFGAADAAKAHALMESGQHIGKIVLTW